MSVWFYEENGQQKGPVDREALERLVREGKIGPERLIWSQGMAGWQPVAEVPGVGEAVASPAAAAQKPKKAGMAIASFVCGVLGLNLCTPIVFPVLAIIFGQLALGGIAQAKGALGGKGYAKTGLGLGFVFLLLHSILLMVVLTSDRSEVNIEFVNDEPVEQFERGELYELVAPEEEEGETEGVEVEPTGELK